jgi:hypothetical protein
MLTRGGSGAELVDMRFEALDQGRLVGMLAGLQQLAHPRPRSRKIDDHKEAATSGGDEVHPRGIVLLQNAPAKALGERVLGRHSCLKLRP